MKPIPTILAACALAAAAPVLGQSSPADRANEPAARIAVAPTLAETMVYRGTVRSIDPRDRLLVVEGDSGGSTAVRVGTDVRNFDNVRPGDRVTIRYTEAIAQSIVEGGDGIRERHVSSASRQAAPGARPGVQAVDRVTLVASVVDVDRERGRLTLRGVEREPVQLRVNDRAMLRDIERGDQVVATYAQSAAVSIEPAR